MERMAMAQTQKKGRLFLSLFIATATALHLASAISDLLSGSFTWISMAKALIVFGLLYRLWQGSRFALGLLLLIFAYSVILFTGLATMNTQPLSALPVLLIFLAYLCILLAPSTRSFMAFKRRASA